MPSHWVIVIPSLVNMALAWSNGYAFPPVPAPAANADSPASPADSEFAAIMFAVMLKLRRACYFVIVSSSRWCFGSSRSKCCCWYCRHRILTSRFLSNLSLPCSFGQYPSCCFAWSLPFCFAQSLPCCFVWSLSFSFAQSQSCSFVWSLLSSVTWSSSCFSFAWGSDKPIKY